MWLRNVIIFLLCYISWSFGHTTNSDASVPTARNRKCEDHIKDYEIGILNGEKWALQMLDATAKLPSSGILSGNLVYLGDFDACLNISHKNEIFGKYCLGALPLPSNDQKDKSKYRNRQTPEARMVAPNGALSGMFAVCLPDSCTAEDFQKYYNNKIFKLNFFEDSCTSKSSKPELDAGDITTISILSVVLYVMLLSTGYEAVTLYMKTIPVHPILISFSLVTNTKKLLQTTSGSGQISCLHGIRVISMMWVVFGHKYAISSMLPSINPASIGEWFLEKQNMIVMGATVSVDTFFLLGGLLVSYGFLMTTSKGFNIFMYYFHRFLRLTPLLAVSILIHATVLKHLGSGPLWNSMIASFSHLCETHWWSTLLYVQNYVNPEGMCIPQTWYLSVDTQLFLLSPLILLPLKHWPKFGLALTGALTVCSIITSFTVGWIDELYGFFIANGDSMSDYMKHYYYQPHTRAGPWLMGIILGYIISDMKQKRKTISINIFISTLLWLVSLAILLACVFTGQNTFEETYTYDRFANSVYIAIMRPGWALGLSWVIFACITGHGGPINWFLSLPMFQVVSKFTYSMYLIHFTMILITAAQTRVTKYFSNLVMMHEFWGDFTFSLGAAAIFTLAFESPILMIEKVIFGKKEKSPQLKEPVMQPDERLQKIEIS